VRNGVKGAFICGSSGEGISLTVRERMELAEAWTRHTPGRLKLIVHVGATNIRDSRELAAHAGSIGADAIASVEPIYYLQPWMADLVSYFSEISSAAPGVPFYSYYIPALTRFNIDYIDFCSRAIRDIPDFAGIKYTNNDLFEFTRLIKRFGGDIDILFGSDELLINALASGSVGAVGSTYNFMPSIYIDLIEKFKEGKLDEARELQIISQEIISLMPRYHGSLVFGKAVMKIIGIDCGPVRLPLRNLSGREIKSLESDLQQTGFFNHCAK
jgi:N-acetylneuraminate lyase